ncbi:hypothetical protein EDB84DRAFT_1560980 [Lactarius hengduanensis]|nr:hypothetical protein EDB84DRAFT_1560980 [Lactarius hengduanensis]
MPTQRLGERKSGLKWTPLAFLAGAVRANGSPRTTQRVSVRNEPYGKQRYGFHQSNVKVHPRIKREHAEPNVTTATVTYPIACRLDYSRITSVSASVPLQTLCHPLRAASPIIYTPSIAATPSAFAPVSLKPPNPVTPAPCDAPPFDIAGEERLLQDIVDKALELVEARLSSRLAITTALLREECKRAAGVIKFGIMNVLARRE